MRRAPVRAAGALVCVLLFGSAPAFADQTPGSVAGQVTLDIADARLSTLGPIIAYLEPLDPETRFDAPSSAVTIEQKNARFSPSFTVVARGQSIDMPNRDAIYHNVFSYSRPNQFDLGTYPAGESRSLVPQHAGVVKTYCSIHESMNGTIFVAPTPFFTRVRPSGNFEIRGVPPGRYRLKTWCEKLPETSREITVAPGRETAAAIPLLDLADE